MMSLRGSETEQNLVAMFAGESQARNRYEFYGSRARSDGFVQIANLFLETANQEKEHAKRLFKFLEGGRAQISGTYPSGVIGSTEENLVAAAAGERAEIDDAYPKIAEIAEEEGFSTVAAAIRAITVAEKHHLERFLSMLGELRNGTLFRKPNAIAWECQNCGYTHSGSAAPEICPACAHGREYFSRKRENWN